MLKVARIGSFPTTDYNTIGKYGFELCQDDRWETYVFAPRYSGKWLQAQNVRAIESHKVWARRDLPPSTLLRLPAFIGWILHIIWVQIKAIAFLRSKHVDVVHIHSQLYSLVALWGKMRGKRVFLTFHGEDYNNMQSSRLLQSLLSCYSSVFVISPLMKETASSYFDGEIVYTPNGVDTTLFKNKNLKRDNTILCVASFKKVKRHLALVRAFAELIKNPHYANYKLILAGDGPLRSEISTEIQALGLDTVVDFVGHLSSNELVSQYNKSQLLVLQSEREGFPKVILEGMACGIRLAVSPVGSIPTILGEDFPFYINDVSPKPFASVIGTALSAPDHSADISAYTWDNLRNTLHKYYTPDD
tara:strand:- start:6524 stop:7603 length:1080 start_codon:yes stop_codon:yes gene_type:complete